MNNKRTIDERMDIWLNREADRDGVEDRDRQAHIDAMRGTLQADWLRLGLAVDDLAATGLHGKIVALVFFGWRPTHAANRKQATGDSE